MTRIVRSTFAVLLLAASCTPSQHIEVTKSQQVQGTPQTIIYSLPQTRLDITIEATKTTIIRGPYAEYAQKYLNIADAPLNNQETYEISSITIVPAFEPDPALAYAITYKQYPENLEKLFALTSQGLILFPKQEFGAVTEIKTSKVPETNVPFDDNLYEPNISEKVDTLYKTILTDSSFVKIPVIKKSVSAKNQEDRAKEMANVLLKLRKRRLKLMLGEYEYHPDGPALKVLSQELAKMEEQYLSLFTGKRIVEKQKYQYTLFPEQRTSKDLCWFSPVSGISEVSKPNSKPIRLELSVKQAETSPVASAEKVTDALYYRIPNMADVSVTIGTEVFTRTRIPVYQAGKIISLQIK